jgi:hypothetical protein
MKNYLMKNWSKEMELNKTVIDQIPKIYNYQERIMRKGLRQVLKYLIKELKA